MIAIIKNVDWFLRILKGLKKIFSSVLFYETCSNAQTLPPPCFLRSAFRPQEWSTTEAQSLLVTWTNKLPQ